MTFVLALLLSPSNPLHQRLAMVTRHRSAAPPTADGAFRPVLPLLALGSAVMVIQLVSSPPAWIKG